MTEANQPSFDLFQNQLFFAHIPIMLIDSITGLILQVNPCCDQLLGCSNTTLVGQNWMRLTHPADIQIELECLKQLHSGLSSSFQLEKRFYRQDGSLVWTRISAMAANTDRTGRHQHTCVLEDISEVKQNAHQLQVLHALSQAMHDSPNLKAGAGKILAAFAQSDQWELAQMWLVDPASDCLKLLESWHVPSHNFERFIERSRLIPFQRGIGLPGRVWKNQTPAWIMDVTKDLNFPRATFALEAGLHGAFAFPILSEGHVCAVIEVFSKELLRPDQGMLEMLKTFGEQLGQFLDHKATEAKLAESELLLSSIIQTLPVAVFAKDIKKDFQWSLWNKKAEEVFGIKAEDCLGKFDEDIFEPSQAEWYRKKDLETLETNGILDIPDEKVITNQGEVTVHTQKIVVRDSSGEPLILLGVSEDITNRKKAETHARIQQERENRYHQVHLEMAQMDRRNPSLTIQQLLRRSAQTMEIERVSYWTFQDQKQSIVCQLLYQRSNDQFSDQAVRIDASQVPAYFQALHEFRSILAEDARKDPRTSEFTENYFIPLGITSLFDVYVWCRGKIVGVLCHEHIGLPLRKWDKTDYELALSVSYLISLALESGARLQAEDDLAESEHILSNMIQFLPHAVFCKNIKQNYMFSMWNEKAEEIFGIRAKEIIGKTDFDFFPKTEAEGFRRKDIEATLSKGLLDIPEEIVHGKNGKLIVQTKKIVVRDAKGEPQYLLGVSEDITQRKQIEANLEAAVLAARAANQSKDRFLANMSHEIRTPLNGVLGMLQVLNLTPLQMDQREMVEVAFRSGEALLALLNDLLDFSKIEAGELTLDIHSFSLYRLMQDAVTLQSPACHAKGLTMVSQIQSGIPDELLGDSTRLRQIITNLLFNAIKFTEQGDIELAVELVSEHADGSKTLKFSVSDTGIGIPPDVQDAIFDPFMQADSSITRKYGGTGLGLPICRRLVQAMGGSLEVNSRPQGGSQFFFALRFHVSTQQETVLRETEKPIDLVKARILVIEDNIVNQMVAVGMLKKLGADADVVGDGEQGLRALENQHYDLVLMDMMMPVMDGLEATRLLRKRESLDEHVPVIAMTANASESDREICLEAGMDDFLPKPIGIDGMRVILARWLGLTTESATPPNQISLSEGAAEVLNPAVLRELKDFLQTDFGMTIQIFLENTEEIIDSLKAAGANRDRNLLMRQAHALKGSSSNVGAVRLSPLCAALQHDALGLEWEVLDKNLTQITQAYKEVKTALQTEWI